MKRPSTPEGIQVGQQFGDLTVVEFAGRNLRYQAQFRVSCECGSLSVVLGTNLKKGNTTRCNSQIHRIDHGASATSEYWVWKGMRRRCHSPKCPTYKDYGGRGIQVAPIWRESFSAFIRDMGRRPSDQHTIERIDNGGDYAPGNCRWATMKEQGRNKRTNRLVTIGGVTKTMTDWSESSGLHLGTLTFRVNKKWPEEEILSTPNLGRRHHS